MQFLITHIEFDFSTTTTPEGHLLFLDDPDTDYDTQQEVIQETKGIIWEADDKDDLIKKITCTIGWCIYDIDYRVLSETNATCLR